MFLLLTSSKALPISRRAASPASCPTASFRVFSPFMSMEPTALIAALFLIGGLIRFITEPWKKKGESLLGLLLTLLVLAVAAFFVLRRLPLPTA